MTIEFHDLTYGPQDLARLTAFYHDHYEKEFPDPDERESLENMVEYLRLREEGWYGPNSYHIVLAVRDGSPVGCSVSDYLSEPNVGVIEFLMVLPDARRGGTGRALLTETERLLDKDARAGKGIPLGHVIAEVNDPRAPSDVADNLDPVARVLIWGRWGYRGLDFPYVQPALSEGQEPVTNLLLIVKSFPQADVVESDTVRAAVHEYLRWAMRIDDPGSSPEYQDMATYLREVAHVPTLSLSAYVGLDSPLRVYDVAGPHDPQLPAVLACYRKAFDGSELAVDEPEFDRALTEVTGYHLWGLLYEDGDVVEGMASLFTLETAGLCGYVTLDGQLRGQFRALVARVECQFLRDSPTARGWYVELGMETEPGPFRAVGFAELAVDYRIPRVDAPVRLLYKPFGRQYGPVRLPASEVQRTLARIATVVYGEPAHSVTTSLDGLDFATFC
ncbi:GNAT family N-acetyltransferase [Actinokineospora inagensis]|uniref:GNAT family N-acetyltransferase n=1 Tax=Actinokineospora inagensis TaxID=103730 RepID=UPI0003FF3401|nr:GNAT family N-acetyltransferase [Actinokineospora inagensis]